MTHATQWQVGGKLNIAKVPLNQRVLPERLSDKVLAMLKFEVPALPEGPRLPLHAYETSSLRIGSLHLVFASGFYPETS